MHNAEAKSLLANDLHTLAGRSFSDLVAMIGDDQVKSVSGESGVNYQIELSVYWDSAPRENLRIMGAIDDGGLRALLPLTDFLIMKPDGTLI
jgi:hypothetical protein